MLSITRKKESNPCITNMLDKYLLLFSLMSTGALGTAEKAKKENYTGKTKRNYYKDYLFLTVWWLFRGRVAHSVIGKKLILKYKIKGTLCQVSGMWSTVNVNCKKHSIVSTVLNCTLCISFCLLPHATNIPLFQISATCRKTYLCCNLNGLIKNNVQPFGTEIFMRYSGNNGTEVL